MRVDAERYSGDAYRLVRDFDVVGFALKLSNGRWGMFDRNDARLTKATYATPAEVAAAFQGLYPTPETPK